MNKKFTKLIAAVALLVFMTPAMVGWGQSDYSTTYTSGVTLSTTGGTSASTCKVIVTGTTEYNGIKAGTGSKAGAMQMTVPSGTKYLHIHVAGWNGETVTLGVTPNTNVSPNSISLTADSGISGSGTTYTLGTPANAPTNYYKVITFTNALTSNTSFTFEATSGKRFVIWGVNAEEEDTDPTISATPASLTGFTYIAGNGPSAAQTISVSGENLTANLGLSLGASSDFEMSLSEDSGYANALELTPTSGAVAATTVYVRLKSGLAVNSSYSGTVTLTSTDATDVTVSLSGSVTNQTYTLTDESGVNGSIAFSASPVEAGTHVVLTPTPASDAYYFVADSWSFFNDALEDVTSSIEFVTGETNTIVMPAYNLHVDATFAAKPTYDVVFDCNGGTSGCPSDMEDVIQGTAITLPAAPTKADNVFTGWNDGTTTYAAGDSYTVNDDVIFTAQWTPGGTGTILFGKKDGGGSTEINDATVTGDDSEGNTWTIKTVGTTSFTNTNNSGYSQVGSSSSPATSITFATKLSSTSTFTGFSAKFGGFNSTAGTVTLKVYNHSTSTETTVGTGSLNGTSDVTISNTSTAVGDSLIVTVTNIARGVKCYYVSYSYSTSSDPIISAPNELSLGSLDTYTEFDYSIINPSTGVTLGATTTDTWISNIIVTADKVSFETTANPSETEDRTGTITLSYAGAESKTVTVTQSKVDYATLPFAFDGGKNELLTGMTATLGDDYGSSPKLGFRATGNYLILHLNEAPTSLSYDIKGNSFSGGTFKVQTSANGTDYEDLATYTALGDKQTVTHIDLASTVRYIKWIYVNKSSGNVALGNIKASANYNIYSDVTVASLTIPADKVCTVYSPATLNVTASLTNEATSEAWNNLVIKDGAQLKTPNAVKGTIEKFVAGYGESTNGNYVLLATPATLDTCNNTGMWTNTAAQHAEVDFYAFDQSFASKEWRNFKYGNTSFAGPLAMTQGTGYLYANKNDVTLTLETRGYVSPNVDWQDHPFAPTNVNQSVTLEYSDGKPFAGYNLIGNPFTCDAYINRDYYRMNAAGDAIVPAASATTAIKPCEGIFVVAANTSDNTVTFTTTAPSTSSAPANVVINLKDSEMVRDRAIVSFDGERDMPRFQFNDAAAKLYIPQGEKEMAKVSSEAQGEMPVNFKADKNGSFTLNVDAANLDVDYLHLIDNMTGADVDLLQTPSYTFDARTTDYASRFRLVFSVNNVPENEDSHSAFAYFNGSEWVINASDNATVQVVDVMGRVILNADAKHGVSTANMPAGVYMLRLINGNDVKVQKIVVR